MLWPHYFSVISNLIHNSLSCWLIGAVGAAAAVLLHRYDKTCRLWPVFPALILWWSCEIAMEQVINVWSTALALGCFAICYAIAWLIVDIIYRNKVKKRKN